LESLESKQSNAALLPCPGDDNDAAHEKVDEAIISREL
jgi:hypothetical protein